MGLIFLATGQPVFKSCHGDRKQTPALTIDERKEFVTANGQRTLGNIPVCMDHAGGEIATDQSTFAVPNNKQIGRLIDSFMLPDGRLLHTIEIFYEHAAISKQIKDDIREQRRPWGISLGTDVVELAGTPFIMQKNISHIGITPDPQYGDSEDGATWIHIAAETPAVFYKAFKEQILDKYPDVFMAPETRERLTHLVPNDAAAVTSGVHEMTAVAAAAPETETPATEALEQTETPNPLETAAVAPVDAPLSHAPTIPFEEPMATVTTPPPAPDSAATPVTVPAPVVNKDNVAVRYGAFEKEFEGLLSSALANPRDLNSERRFSADVITSAKKLKGEIESLTSGRGLGDIPATAASSYLWLGNYLDSSSEVLKKHADEIGIPDLGMKMRTGGFDASMRVEPMDIAKTLLASHAHGLRNAEAYRLEKEAENAKYNTTLADIERYRNSEATKDKEIARLLQENAEIKARATIAAVAAPISSSPSSNNATLAALNQASTVLGATAAGVNMVSVGASRDTGKAAAATPALPPLRYAPALTGANSSFFADTGLKNQLHQAAWSQRSTVGRQ